MSGARLLGIDVSTTAVKALLLDEEAQVVGTASAALALSTPRPLWSEQDPEDWWRGTVTSVHQVLAETGTTPERVVAVGLTGQMHGLTLLDETGAVLRPAILWNDQRTAEQCEDIRRRVGPERLIEITGNDALPGFTAPKMLWVRQYEPEVYARARHALLPKDYVRYRLSGTPGTDRAGAAGTLLLDVRTRDWSPEVLAALDIDADLLPPTHEGPETTGEISMLAAAATGLRAGTPIVAGGGDQAAQAVGVGAVSSGIMALTLGTSGVIFATTDEPFVEPRGRLHAFCHAVPGRWHLMGVMLSAGGSLGWYRDRLAPGKEWDTLLAPAADVTPGCEGLLFLPYLTGERTPHPDPLARGAFVGLTVRHERAHLTRAILEGVGFGLRDGLELMRSAGLPEPREVRVSGGGARSELWRGILADILGVSLIPVTEPEGAAHGAAILAGVGHGIWPDVEAGCALAVSLGHGTEPRAENHGRYEESYGIYRDLYPALRQVSHRLSESFKS